MNRFMEIALAEARSGINAGHGGPFGCVIVKDGRVIASAHNEVLLQKDPTCHGEVNAIRRACRELDSFNLSGCELYTTAEPCPMCLGAIRWANIGRVWYGCNIRDTAGLGFRDEEFCAAAREDICTCIDRSECMELFEEYRSLEGKTEY